MGICMIFSLFHWNIDECSLDTVFYNRSSFQAVYLYDGSLDDILQSPQICAEYSSSVNNRQYTDKSDYSALLGDGDNEFWWAVELTIEAVDLLRSTL